MKKAFTAFLSLLSILCTGTPAVAATETYSVGRVIEYYVWPQNRNPYTTATKFYLALKIDGLPASGCNTTGRVVIGSDHPMFEAVLSIALTTKTTDQIVNVAYLDTCSVWSNSADLSQIFVNE